MIAVKRRKNKSIMWCEIFSQWRIGVRGRLGYTTSTVLYNKSIYIFEFNESQPALV